MTHSTRRRNRPTCKPFIAFGFWRHIALSNTQDNHGPSIEVQEGQGGRSLLQAEEGQGRRLRPYVRVRMGDRRQWAKGQEEVSQGAASPGAQVGRGQHERRTEEGPRGGWCRWVRSAPIGEGRFRFGRPHGQRQETKETEVGRWTGRSSTTERTNYRLQEEQVEGRCCCCCIGSKCWC